MKTTSVIILLGILLIFIIFRGDFLIEKKFNNQVFLVLDDKLSEKSSEILYEINNRLKRFLDCVRNINDSRIRVLISKTYDSKIVESSDETYTVNRTNGMFDKIHLCLKKDGNFFDIDTLMFVVIHELTHCMRKIDFFDTHPRDFWQDNKYLLNLAEKCGIMKMIDYRIHPVNYCNVYINSNPHF